MLYERGCPFCGKKVSIELDDKAIARYQAGENIIKAFPNLNAFQRDIIILGTCQKCWEKTYNTPAFPEQNPEGWGTRVGECLCCERPIWTEKDKVEVGKEFFCRECGTTMIWDGTGITEVEGEEGDE